MHSLRNATKNERIRKQLTNLVCFWEQPHPDDLDLGGVAQLDKRKPAHITHAIIITDNLNPRDEDFEETSYDVGNDYNYDHQQDSSSSHRRDSRVEMDTETPPGVSGVETTRDPSERYLFQIPVNELPCPLTEQPTEETLRKNLNTPAYSDSNSGTSSHLHYLLALIAAMLIVQVV